MIQFRKATNKDLDQLLDLVEMGFSVQHDSFSAKEGQEHRVLFSYLYISNPTNLERVFLAEEHGVLKAAVGVIPQQLFFEGVKIPIWAISPVVTHPDYRNQGIASKCLEEVLADLREQKVPAVFLWGLPDYYPQFGFVPLLPRYKTKLTLAQLRTVKSVPGVLRIFQPDDLNAVARLYNQGNDFFWLQPERELAWWRLRINEMDIEMGEIKEVPFSKKENFLVWENQLNEVCGYLYFDLFPKQAKIEIKEGTAIDNEVALGMLQSFCNQYLKPNWQLWVRGTPEHYLNLAAYRLGGTHLNPAPLAGMIKI